MSKDVRENPEKLHEYRKTFNYVYLFSDGIFKILMVNNKKPERIIKFLNAMLGLEGEKAITKFTVEMSEIPGVLDQKTVVLDIFGTTQANEPVLVEVQQCADTLFVDRLIYYTSRMIGNLVKKSKDYNLPHVYVLALLTRTSLRLRRILISITPRSFAIVTTPTKSWTYTS